MTELGKRFRMARDERGLSLAEASTLTRILPRYLEALEAGDYKSLPGDVYARGFIRNYAQILDLPAEELILLYRQERGEPTGKIKVVPAAMPPRTRSCLVPSISFLGTLFVILTLVALIYFGAQGLGLFAKRSDIAIRPSATPIRPTPTTFPTATEQIRPSAGPATGNPGSGGAPGPTATLAPPNPLSVLTATAPQPVPTPTPTPSGLVVGVAVMPQAVQGSWLEVRVDGIPTFNQLLRAGQSAQWTPQRDIYMNIGDTSAIVLTVNGRACAGFPGGIRGVPRRITITANTCP